MRSENVFLIEMGQQIRNLRRHKKISLRNMSVISGIDLSGLSHIENGKSDVHILMLKKIADVLEVDVKYFL
jgi:transcriptional regulator with XRE-family HTH domain